MIRIFPALVGFASLVACAPSNLALPQKPVNIQTTQQALIFYELERDTRFGTQLTYQFTGIDVYKGITIHAADIGIPLLRKTTLHSSVGGQVVQPGKYFLSEIAMYNPGYENRFHLSNKDLQIKLEAGKAYFIGKFHIAPGSLGGKTPMWSPGNADVAQEACTKTLPEGCTLELALFSHAPVMKTFQKWH